VADPGQYAGFALDFEKEIGGKRRCDRIRIGTASDALKEGPGNGDVLLLAHMCLHAGRGLLNAVFVSRGRFNLLDRL
jgi:hypothetical protein